MIYLLPLVLNNAEEKVSHLESDFRAEHEKLFGFKNCIAFFINDTGRVHHSFKMAKSTSTGYFEIPKSTENLSSNHQIYRFKMAKSPSTALLEIPKSTENLGTNPQIYSQILAKSPVYRKASPPTPPYDSVNP